LAVPKSGSWRTVTPGTSSLLGMSVVATCMTGPFVEELFTRRGVTFGVTMRL
jgi:hypothetical protein